MIPERPLVLKRQRAISIPRAKKFDLQAEVILDIPPFHLADPFTYGFTESQVDHVVVGAKVRVPFRSTSVEGYVVALQRKPAQFVKPIIEILSKGAIPEELLTAVEEIAARYATRKVDILKLIPEVDTKKVAATTKGGGQIRFHQTTGNIYESALNIVSPEGRTLLIAPTEREINHLALQAQRVLKKPVVKISSQGGIRVRRAQMQAAVESSDCLVISARGGIFLPIIFTEVVIVGDISSHYWEQRFPFWNLRDVALIRSQLSAFDLTFASPTPSLEIQRLLDIGLMNQSKNRPERPRQSFTFAPDSFHATIRAGISRGLVLVSVADKTYSNFFLCDRCRTKPICSCGGRIIMNEEPSPSCSLCGKEISDWRCGECGSNQRRLIRKGAARISVELGKAFPNVPIYSSSSSQTSVDGLTKGIVVATPGSEPLDCRYTGLVLLDGDALIARGGLRGEELLRGLWSKLLGFSTPDASVFLSLPTQHPISQTLLSGNFQKALRNEMLEREQLHLPPMYRLLSITGPERDLSTIAKELQNELPDLKISSILRSKTMSSYVNIRFHHKQARELTVRLVALQRYRSSTRRDLLTITFDPLII